MELPNFMQHPNLDKLKRRTYNCLYGKGGSKKETNFGAQMHHWKIPSLPIDHRTKEG